MAEGSGTSDRPWWGHVTDVVAGEPLAAAVLLAAALPLALGAAILALGRRLGGRRSAS
jgi:hypothetical protein